MTRLPNAEQASLDIRKLEDYCLNPLHPRGRHKARVFREALGIGQADAAWLRDILLGAVRSADASRIEGNEWGTYWRLDVPVQRQNKSAVVRTIWMVRADDRQPALVTCWVL